MRGARTYAPTSRRARPAVAAGGRRARRRYLGGMRRRPRIVVVFAAAVASAMTACDPPTVSDWERGRYLVEQVGMCADCHTPRGDMGAPLLDRWLQGAPVDFTPKAPMPFAAMAPSLAGLPTLPDDADALRFLTTGALPGGRPLLPPMPQYRFDANDARAVLAYLRAPKAPAR
jgi:mono/diheme cytochrome c family protein